MRWYFIVRRYSSWLKINERILKSKLHRSIWYSLHMMRMFRVGKKMTYWTLITRTVITTKERLSFSSPGRNRSLVVLASDNSVSQWNYIKKTDDLYWTLNWPNEWCSSLSMPTSYKLWLLSLWLKRWNLHQPIRNVDHLNIIMFDSMKCNCSTIDSFIFINLYTFENRDSSYQ